MTQIKNKDRVVSVVGLGYIGLPTAAVLASKGVTVVGVDVSCEVVETVNRGQIHIVEPGLEDLVKSAVSAGRLKAYLKPQPADVFLIAVPTPFKEQFEPDLRHIESACRALAPILRPGNLVILESTSPVGATEQMARWLADARQDLRFPHQSDAADIRIAYCPERVLPGQMLRELVENDRIIGGMDESSSDAACELYGSFVDGQLIRTDSRTAEMCKLSENAFRDLNIAFANELSLIAARLDVDVWELIRLANHHPRVNILQPGPGVGGHCIAVDPWFIISAAPDLARLTRVAREVNDSKPDYVVDQILEKLKGIEHPVVACLGLAFKPDVDDLRESPAQKIAERLAAHPHLTVLAVEPHVSELPFSLAAMANVELVGLAEALERADVCAALVKHHELKTACSGARIDKARFLDFVNLLDAGAVPGVLELVDVEVPALAGRVELRR